MIRTLACTILLASVTLSSPGFAKEPPCYCRDGDGNQVAPGELRCFTIGSRTFTSMCDWSLNTLTWRKQHDGCLSS